MLYVLTIDEAYLNVYSIFFNILINFINIIPIDDFLLENCSQKILCNFNKCYVLF